LGRVNVSIIRTLPALALLEDTFDFLIAQGYSDSARDSGGCGHHAGDNNSGAPGRRDETRCPARASQKRHSLCDRSLRNAQCHMLQPKKTAVK